MALVAAKPAQRTTKSTATLLDAANVDFDHLNVTGVAGTTITVVSTDPEAVVLQGGLKAAKATIGSAFFETLGQFNANLVMHSSDFIMYLGSPRTADTWRLRINGGFLLFEKYDMIMQDYVSRFHLY
jgi:hypothetical protein